MKKVSIFLFIALTTFFAGLIFPSGAVAVSTTGKMLIVDEAGILSEAGLQELNETARAVSMDFGLDIAFFLVTGSYTPGQRLSDYVAELYLETHRLGPDGFALAHDVDSKIWTLVPFGMGDRVISETVEDRFWDVYDEEDTYFGGILAYLGEVHSYLTHLTTIDNDGPLGVISELLYVADRANLLSDPERRGLEARAEAIAANYPCQVRIVTVNDIREYGYTNIEDFNLYLYNAYNMGYGIDRDCVILLLSTAERDYDFRVWGDYGKSVFTFYGIDELLDSHVLPPLSRNEYYKAFSAYLDRAELYFSMAQEGRPFDTKTDPVNAASDFAVKLAVVILVPALIAWIACHSWKSKMKTAKIARFADSYIPADGFNLTGKEDTFLYRTATRVYINRDSSSSGGGGARLGGGGSIGRSGKF